MLGQLLCNHVQTAFYSEKEKQKPLLRERSMISKSTQNQYLPLKCSAVTTVTDFRTGLFTLEYISILKNFKNQSYQKQIFGCVFRLFDYTNITSVSVFFSCWHLFCSCRPNHSFPTLNSVIFIMCNKGVTKIHTFASRTFGY